MVLASPMIGSKRSSVGVIVPSTDVKVVSPTSGETLGANETGELLFRGPSLLKGYLKLPQLNEEMMDDDGFFRTGAFTRQKLKS